MSLELLILGVFQGIFEWLPVSSEGQLYLLGRLMGVESVKALSAAIFLHLGTSLAAFLYYGKDYLRALRGGEGLVFLVVGTLSSLVTAAPIYFLLENVTMYEDLLSIAVGLILILVGVLLRKAETSVGRKKRPDLRDSLVTGLAQGLALMPGVSRSAVTISVLMLRGLDLESSLKYSFMLGGIATFIAGISKSGDTGSLWVIIPTMVTGLVVLHLLERISKRIRMSTFAFVFGFISIALAGVKIWIE